MQALYWHPVCESVLTLSLITPGWELDPSQHAGGWPLLSLQEAGPLSACCLVATGQHQCHHFIITQADSWTSLSKQEALSQSALHLHFNPTARLKEGPLSPDLWNGDICGLASFLLQPNWRPNMRDKNCHFLFPLSLLSFPVCIFCPPDRNKRNTILKMFLLHLSESFTLDFLMIFCPRSMF